MWPLTPGTMWSRGQGCGDHMGVRETPFQNQTPSSRIMAMTQHLQLQEGVEPTSVGTARAKLPRNAPDDLFRLPGEFGDRAIPAAWYAHRLGMDRRDVRAALRFYVHHLFDLGPNTSDHPVKGNRAVAYYAPTLEGDVEYTAPRRVKFQEVHHPDGYSIDAWDLWKKQGCEKEKRPRPECCGEALSMRHVLGHLWRGRVLGLLGADDEDAIDPAAIEEHADKVLGGWWSAADFDIGLIPALAHLLAADLEHPRCPKVLADAVLGSWQGERPPPRWRGHADLVQRLMLGRKDRWFNVGTGCEHLRVVVVDLDGKEERDQDHLRARLRLFTGNDAFPSPHLIVTSRSGRGRHLYWFTVERTGRFDRRAKRVQMADACSGPLVERLEKVGVHVGPGTIEVFPQPKGRMPPLPFGPRSYLCASDGVEVVERDPIRAMVAWHRRFASAPLSRYRAVDFQLAKIKAVGTAVLRTLADPAPSRPRREAATASMRATSSVTTPHPGHRDATRNRMLRSRDRAVWEAGATRGQTWEDLPCVARFIKHGLRGGGDPDRTVPSGVDRERFHEWYHRGDYALRPPGSGATCERLMWQLEWLFPGVVPYASSIGRARPLSVGEVLGAVRHVADTIGQVHPGLSWPNRKACLAVLLRMLSLAEEQEPGVHVAVWQAKQEEAHFYRTAKTVRLMVDLGIVHLWVRSIPPKRWGGKIQAGGCAEYKVPTLERAGPLYWLWPADEHDTEPTTDLLGAVITAVGDDDDLGASLYGNAVGWRRLLARR